MLLQELDLLIVRYGTGHHIDRHARAISPGQRDHFLKMYLQQRSARNRANGIQALRVVESETAPLPSGNYQHADLASCQRFGSPSPRFAWVEKPTPLAILDSHRRRRLGAARHRGPILRGRRIAKQLRDLFEVDAFDLAGKLLLPSAIQFVPKPQQVLLAVAMKQCGQSLAVWRSS